MRIGVAAPTTFDLWIVLTFACIVSTAFIFYQAHIEESRIVDIRRLTSNKLRYIGSYVSLLQDEVASLEKDLDNTSTFLGAILNETSSAGRQYSHLRKGLSYSSSSDSNGSSELGIQSQFQHLHSNHAAVSYVHDPSVSEERLEQLIGEITPELTMKWFGRLQKKMSCLEKRSGGLYFYHVRKAAGTTLRDFARLYILKKGRSKFIETEGISLDQGLLHLDGYLSVTTLRHPIDRIVSLYWYEHVSWFQSVQNQTDKIKTFHNWTEAWLDGSDWKTDFVAKNAGTVYVEIENYYVKMLTGWQGPQKVTAADLAIAKKILDQFDVIVIMEWLRDVKGIAAAKSAAENGSVSTNMMIGISSDMVSTLSVLQTDFVDALFPSKKSFAHEHKTTGNHQIRNNQTLLDAYAPDIDEVVAHLRALNEYDIELYEYAKMLVAKRLAYVKPRQRVIRASMNAVRYTSTSRHLSIEPGCGTTLNIAAMPQFKKKVGIYRPPYHKGPFTAQEMEIMANRSAIEAAAALAAKKNRAERSHAIPPSRQQGREYLMSKYHTNDPQPSSNRSYGWLTAELFSRQQRSHQVHHHDGYSKYHNNVVQSADAAATAVAMAARYRAQQDRIVAHGSDATQRRGIF